MRLLSIDWDFFFPSREGGDNLEDALMWDWGHNENWRPFLNEFLWLSRASAFLGRNFPLPLTSGAEDTFWGTVKLSKSAQLFIADSHVRAATPEVMKGITEVVNYDAHHDGGYGPDFADLFKKQEVDCSNWMFAYEMIGAKLFQRYPEWRLENPDAPPTALMTLQSDYWFEESSDPELFHRVFICRSGSWTPPWVDDKFVEFVKSCPAFSNLRGKQAAKELLESREWSDKMAIDMATSNAALVEVLKAADVE